MGVKILHGNVAAFAFALLSIAGGPDRVAAQDNQAATVPVVRIREGPSCSACRISQVTVATIPDAEFEIETEPVAVARTSGGRYLVGGRHGKLGVFDQGGKLLRTFGRRGGGPGEFQSIWRIYVGYRDTVLVYDMFARRMTVIDPGITRVVRTYTFVDHRDFFPLHNGSFIASGSMPTVRNSGLSLHLISANGVVMTSASADSVAFRRQPDRMLGRSLSFVSESSFIAAPMHRYRFELWSDNLKLQRIYERSVNWFPALSDGLILDIPSRTPLPMQLKSVSASGYAGVLVAELFSGSANFKPDPALVDRRTEISARESGSGSSLNRYVDTMFEFIELKTASVLATRRFPGFFGSVYQAPGSQTAPLYYVVREGRDGGNTFEIVRFDLLGHNDVPRNH